ncbi:MAG: oligosaccharide flippase family protein [Thermoguttaceae bacterium]
MSLGFDNAERPAGPAPLPTDTLVDSVLILLALTVVQRLVGFVRAVLFCRWLDADQLGQWDMAFSFFSLAAPLCVLAIPGSFGRYLEYYRQRGQLRMFLRRTMTACGLLALLAVSIVASARTWFSTLVFGDAEHVRLIAIIAGCLLMVVVYSYLTELFTAMRHVRLVSIMQLANSVTFAVAGAGLLLCWRCTAESVIVAYGGACLVAAVWAGCHLPRVWKSAPSAGSCETEIALWSKIVPCALWVLLANTLTNLFDVVDRYMIVHFSTMPAVEALRTVGNYHSSRLVPMLLVSVATMLAIIVTPHLSHHWEAGRRARAAMRLRLFAKLFGLAGFAGMTVVLLAGPLLFAVLFRGKFPEGEAVLPWTLLYCSWIAMQMILQTYLLCVERAWLSAAALGCGLALSVGLNFVLLPRYGLYGAVVATTIAHALTLGLICAFNRRWGFRLDEGMAVVLLLPLAFCGGRWVALAALAAVAAAMGSRRLLDADERQLLAEKTVLYAERFGVERFVPKAVQRAADRTPSS